MFEFRVLGGLEVRRDGAHLPVPSRRQRALIARLVLARGQVVAADALVSALWEADPPPRARHAVHTYVSRVRSLLGAVVVTRPPGYLLAVEPTAIDAELFEAGAAQAAGLAAQRPDAAVALFDEVLALWRGPAYAEFAETFAQPAAVRLEELRLAALEDRAAALIAAGVLDRAIGDLGEFVTDQPLRERPHALLMRALHRSGRQGDALAVYRQFRDRLRDELGLDPSPTLRETHAWVLRQEAGPAVAAATPAPPPATPAPAPGTPIAGTPIPAPPIPAPLTTFVGREQELDHLLHLVDECRLVTLAGPGGVGKTRLARELIARHPANGAAVWWVDLVPAREPADVAYRFVDALGLPEPAEGGLDDFLIDSLRATRGLLIADNCEHVIEAAAALLERIAESCPGVVVLATSRERLAVPGEQVVAVAPLALPPGEAPQWSPAVALFADRLQASGGPVLTGADAELAAEVCRRVDGLPLAIELAAARARSLGLATLAERPTLDLLSGGRRTEQARHRSLRAVLDWSHDLLGSQERILFRRLAAFTSSFTLDDAEQVCVDGALTGFAVPDALAGLVDKSLVSGPANRRYRLPHPVHAYAAEQLAAHGEDLWVGAAHARHTIHVAEEAARGLYTERERQCAAQLAELVDELRAAHRWACANDADLAVRLAVAVAPYASHRMRYEMQDWAGIVAELPGARHNPLRATALASAATGAWARGDFVAAQRLARRGLAAIGEGGSSDPRAAWPKLVLGDIALMEGRFADADRAYTEVIKLARDTEPGLACEGLGGRAITNSYLGRPDAARRFADAGQQVARDTGAPGLVALSLYFAGESRLPTNPAEALELLEEARRLATDAGARFVIGLATLSLVSIRARASADPLAGLVTYREAIDHWRRVGNRTQQWVTLRNLVPALVRAGRYELACVLNGALASAPVRLPAEVPEAAALAEAVAEARRRLGGGAAEAAGERGGRLGLEELISAVQSQIDAVTTSTTTTPTDHLDHDHPDRRDPDRRSVLDQPDPRAQSDPRAQPA